MSDSGSKTRRIGGREIFCIGYGTMGLSAYYGAPLSDEARFEVLDAVYASGCNYWDSADMYGDSEELLGKWFKRTGKRSEIFLATKFGFVVDPAVKGIAVNGSAAYARSAIDASLKKLGVDYVDLYYLHRPDPKVPIEVTVGALAEFVKEGKIKHIGLSECSASTLRRAHAVHPIAAVEVEYSPFTLDIEFPEVGLLAAARELGVAVVAYSPLGRGLLTGQYKSPDDFEEDDFRRAIPRYSKKNFPNILALANALQAIGNRHGATGGQVALAWLLAQGVIPIPGTTRVKYLKENIGGADLVLTDAEIAEVRAIAENAEVAIKEGGARYPEGMHQQLFADTPPLGA
ncbi:hypothetical protein M0805_006185 [Coniferiporia weirii]|nr:hypothetical protein M0805_006185 [Coniferiporia weirii]